MQVDVNLNEGLLVCHGPFSFCSWPFSLSILSDLDEDLKVRFVKLAGDTQDKKLDKILINWEGKMKACKLFIANTKSYISGRKSVEYSMDGIKFLSVCME